MGHTPRAVVSLAALLLITALSAHADDDDWGNISDQDWAVLAPDDYPEADAVVILDKGHTDITRDQIKSDFYIRIKILTETGVERAGNRFITLDEHDDLKQLDARTVLPTGEKVEVDRNAVFEKQYGPYRAMAISFPAVEPGCILEYRYTIVQDEYFHPPSWFFQGSLYVLQSEFSFAYAENYQYNISYQHVPLVNQEPEVEELLDPRGSTWFKKKILTWHMENLPPIKNEPYMSCLDDYRSSLRFQLVSIQQDHHLRRYYTTWPQLGNQYGKYLDEYCNDRRKIEKLARQVTDGLTSDIEKSEALYDYVVNDFATSSEYAFFANEKMSQMLNDKRGRGPEKNLLLAKLHQALNIPSWPVLISTRNNARFDPGYPDLRQFNYIIAFVKLGDQWEFLDAANRFAPYGILPANCLTDGGFLIDGKDSKLVKMTTKPITSARIDRTEMFMAGDGTVTCSTQVDLSGYYASTFAEEFEQRDEKDFLMDHFFSRLEAEYEEGEHHCRMDSLNQFVIDVSYSAPGLF
ncbi:MAG: DUF3857 domain-containing protein, partial [Anaerolineales bacterium]